MNPYQGIRIGPGGNELHLVRNVFGTPLRTGIRYDSTTDIGRLERISFSPHWWCRSGLPRAPRRVDWIRANGTAIHMLRSDWEYVADVAINGYRRGYLISEGVRGAANAEFYHPMIRNCTTAMDRLKGKGGGIAFLQGGDYLIEGTLNVPSSVELRGVHDVPHHTMGGGSVLHVYPPDSDTPTITLASDSGLRGLSFNYPGQRMNDVTPFPFLIQGRGDRIHMINVNAANPFRFIDLMTYRCDDHFVDYASGAPLKTGIAIGGGSRNGIVKNTQFNPHYAVRTPPGNGRFTMRNAFRRLWEYQKENLDALAIGACSGEFLYQNLVAMSSQDRTAIKVAEGFDAEATLVNSMVWGDPDLLADIGNGTLVLQNLHAHRHGRGLQLTGGTLHA